MSGAAHFGWTEPIKLKCKQVKGPGKHKHIIDRSNTVRLKLSQWDSDRRSHAVSKSMPMEINFSLPPEVCVAILQNLDVPSLCAAAQCCHRWHNFIKNCSAIWRPLCYKWCPPKLMERDRALGFTWKEIVQRHYGDGEIRRKWLGGFFSHVTCYEVLPQRSMCVMDAETWGQILEQELSR